MIDIVEAVDENIADILGPSAIVSSVPLLTCSEREEERGGRGPGLTYNLFDKGDGDRDGNLFGAFP